ALISARFRLDRARAHKFSVPSGPPLQKSGPPASAHHCKSRSRKVLPGLISSEGRWNTGAKKTNAFPIRPKNSRRGAKMAGIVQPPERFLLIGARKFKWRSAYEDGIECLWGW